MRSTRFTFLLGLLVLLSLASASSATDAWKSSRQMLVVTTADWNAVPGVLHRFERDGETNAWREVGRSFPIVVGRSGLGWGAGLHQIAAREGEPIKKEGDGKSPAGVFLLSSAFGIAEPSQVKWIQLPYLQLLAPIECVDDAKSPFYNKIVDRQKIEKPDWTSSEKMLEYGEAYRLGIFVEHNRDPIKAAGGSCIFLHLWKNNSTGTSGCTAMTGENIEALLRWLHPDKKPILAQMPKDAYEQNRTSLRLPEIVHGN